MIFVNAATNKEIWLTFRKELYHDLSEEFDKDEMKEIEISAYKESYLILNGDEYIGLLELSLRNIVDGCLSSPVAYIEGILVKSEHRNKKFGSRIINWAKEWGRSKNCTEIGSDVELKNIGSQHFHKNIGFEETYRTVGYRMDL